MQTQTYITEMRQDHFDQSASLVSRSFLEMNSIWKRYKSQYEEIIPILRENIKGTPSGLSHCLMKGEKIIGVTIQHQLLYYLQKNSKPSQIQLFKRLDQAGKQLESKVDYSDLKRGEAVYTLYAVIDPEEAKKGLSFQFWQNSMTIARIRGWKYLYSRVSNPVTLKMLLKFGAEIVAETEFQNDKLWMIRIELGKIWPSYSLIKKNTKTSNDFKPKL